MTLSANKRRRWQDDLPPSEAVLASAVWDKEQPQQEEEKEKFAIPGAEEAKELEAADRARQEQDLAARKAEACRLEREAAMQPPSDHCSWEPAPVMVSCLFLSRFITPTLSE
jgi:hypothetical protein